MLGLRGDAPYASETKRSSDKTRKQAVIAWPLEFIGDKSVHMIHCGIITTVSGFELAAIKTGLPGAEAWWINVFVYTILLPDPNFASWNSHVLGASDVLFPQSACFETWSV